MTCAVTVTLDGVICGRDTAGCRVAEHGFSPSSKPVKHAHLYDGPPIEGSAYTAGSIPHLVHFTIVGWSASQAPGPAPKGDRDV